MRQGGFTLIGILFLVAGLGVGLAAVGTVWQTLAKREKEQELLFVGNQYRQAIASYYQRSSGEKQYPPRLADLLEDPRFPNKVRHLRQLYRDPITGGAEWGMVREGQGIVGVHSLSGEEPLKKAGFNLDDAAFEGKALYSEWVFAFKPQQLPPKGQSQETADPKPQD